MSKKLPGEDLELILAEYDSLLLGDVYDIAVKQEERGNSGLALKIYEYAVKRFKVSCNDTTYERYMGAVMYTALGKLYFFKEEYDTAEVALYKAGELNAGNLEAFYWEAEICAAKGFIDNAKTLFRLVLEKSNNSTLIAQTQRRLNDFEKKVIN